MNQSTTAQTRSAIDRKPPAPLLAAAAGLLASHAAGAPTAAVYELADHWTAGATGLAELLEFAGFEVTAIDPDTLTTDDPVSTADVIALGSFVSESAPYRIWRDARAADLLARVACGTVLLEMTQADQTQDVVPFTPPGTAAVRGDTDAAPLLLFDPTHPLVMALPLAPELADTNRVVDLPTHLGRPVSWETFQTRVQLHAVAGVAQIPMFSPTILEARHGDGRVILTSLFLDKINDAAGDPIGDARTRAAAHAFALGLRRVVEQTDAREPVPGQPVGPDLAEPFGTRDLFDILTFAARFAAGEPETDLTRDGAIDLFDLLTWFTLFSTPCP